MNAKMNKRDYCNENNTLAGAAVATCQKLVTVMEKMKDRMLQEFSARLAAHESVLRMALNEAEALAWETQYPHLVFATLAREKAQAAAAWENHQQRLLQNG
jgi:hypothetical protein